MMRATKSTLTDVSRAARATHVVLVTLLALGGFGCEGTIIEVEPVPADYTEWYSVETYGEIPGHGDSYRKIFVNELGRCRGVECDYGGDLETFSHYPPGTILVKEIYERDVDAPGAFRYTAVMRKTTRVPGGAELKYGSHGDNAGWLFTYLDDGVGGDEEYRSSCWDSCHSAAPIDGAFLDYGAR